MGTGVRQTLACSVVDDVASTGTSRPCVVACNKSEKITAHPVEFVRKRQGLADIARHVIGCRWNHETRVQCASDNRARRILLPAS